MKHHDLTRSPPCSPGDLQAMLAARDCDFWPVFDSAMQDPPSRAGDADDAARVDERADAVRSAAGVG